MIASVGGGGSLAVRFPKRSEVCFHRVVITYNLLHNTSVVTYYLLEVYGLQTIASATMPTATEVASASATEVVTAKTERYAVKCLCSDAY